MLRIFYVRGRRKANVADDPRRGRYLARPPRRAYGSGVRSLEEMLPCHSHPRIWLPPNVTRP
jgi:hypothetical protein